MNWESAEVDRGALGQSSPSADSGNGKKKKGKSKRFGCLIAVAIVVVVVIAFRAVSCSSNAVKETAWPTSGLAAMLPAPESGKAEIMSNSDDTFSAHVNNYSETSYDKYVESCKEKGFTVDAKKDTSSYEAYSEDGHHLSLSLISKQMFVELEAPVEMSDFSWPATGLGALVPAPSSHKGSISVDSSSHLRILVGDTTEEDYRAYVDSCISQGFDVNYSRSDDVFSAKDATGNSLRVEYEGFSTMSIDLYAAKENASSSDSTAAGNAAETSQESSSSSDSSSGASSGGSGVTPEFKEAMDSYEAFMDEYVAFMDKYNNSDNPSSMMGDYANYMQRYAEFVQKIDAIDEDSLSDADVAYYLEVTGRVLQKLQSVS